MSTRKEELKIIFKIAKIIEQEMSKFIAEPRSHATLLQKLQELHIFKFRQECKAVLGLPDLLPLLPEEDEISKLIILLGNINTKFIAIEKLIYNPPNKIDLFKYPLIEQLQKHLKAIREELNKFELDNEPNQLSDSTSPAPGT